ncbi:hypothetical protein [Salinicoccus roseus]|uniref:phage tail protein n=1 Tax=Salinicoccus roseus TaxID=45670 RepID=UPI00356A5E26
MDNVSTFVARIKANIRDYERNMAKAQAMAQSMPDEIETEVAADISKFRRGMLRAQALAQRFESFDIVKTIDFHIRRDPFKTINFREFITEVDEMTDRFQYEMNRLARSIQSFGVVMSNQIRGVIISSLLSLVPIIAGTVAAIMAIGNALGVVVGAVGGFVGALGIAGLGAAAYIGLIATVLSRYNDEAFEATEASNRFTNALDQIKSTWNEIVDNNMDAIFMTMGQAIYAANFALEQMTPFIDAVVNSMRGMTNELKNFVMNSPTMLTFFDNLNEKGVTVFENIIRGIGRFGQGIVDMFNAGMPLIEYIAQGFENLGTRFSEWSARMREENGFQAFTEYVQENLPKIGSIFGSTFEGIINLFAAFGENSQVIFDRLVEMSNSFKTWSENIKQSDGFQQFVNYVQTNGPTVMSLIGNIVMMIVNFAIAVAPLAQKVLEVTTNITGWISEMLRAHPIIGQIIGVLTILFGAFRMIAPAILQVRYVLIPMIAAFSKFMGVTSILKTGLGLLSAAFAFLSTPITIIVGVIATLTAAFSILYQKNEAFRNLVQQVWSYISNFIVSTVATIVMTFNNFRAQGQSIFQAAMSTIVSLISTGFNNALMFIGQFIVNGLMRLRQFGVQIVANIGVALAQFVSAISTWLTNGLSKIAIFISTAISNLVTFGAQMVTTIISALGRFVAAIASGLANAYTRFTTFVSNTMSVIVSFIASLVSNIVSGMSRFVSSITSGVSNAYSRISSFVSNAISAIGRFVSNLVSRITSGMSSFISAIASGTSSALSALSSFVSSAISAIVNFVSQIVSNIVSGMARFVSAIVSGGASAVSAVVSMGSQIVSSVRGFIGSMISAGADLIGGLVNGIRSAAGRAVSAAKSVVSDAIGAAKSLLGINSPSRVFRDIGQYTSQGLAIGINRDADRAVREVTRMSNDMTKAYAPELSGINAGMDAELNGISRRIDHTIKDDMENGIEIKQNANINLNLGERSYRGFAEDIANENTRTTNLEESYLGGVY